MVYLKTLLLSQFVYVCNAINSATTSTWLEPPRSIQFWTLYNLIFERVVIKASYSCCCRRLLEVSIAMCYADAKQQLLLPNAGVFSTERKARTWADFLNKASWRRPTLSRPQSEGKLHIGDLCTDSEWPRRQTFVGSFWQDMYSISSRFSHPRVFVALHNLASARSNCATTKKGFGCLYIPYLQTVYVTMLQL